MEPIPIMEAALLRRIVAHHEFAENNIHAALMPAGGVGIAYQNGTVCLLPRTRFVIVSCARNGRTMAVGHAQAARQFVVLVRTPGLRIR